MKLLLRSAVWGTVVALLLTLQVFAADAKTGTETAKPEPAKAVAKVAPKVPLEMESEYFRADGIVGHLNESLAQIDAQRVQLESQKKDAVVVLTAASSAIITICGKESHAVSPAASEKHVTCVLNPPPASTTPAKQ